jgi:hypothetical protein
VQRLRNLTSQQLGHDTQTSGISGLEAL